MRGKLPMDEIREEIDRQLDRFQAVMMRAPDFVDGHQHVQALPAICGALLDALEQRRFARASAGCATAAIPLHRILLRGAQVKKALVVRGLAAAFAAPRAAPASSSTTVSPAFPSSIRVMITPRNSSLICARADGAI